MKKIFSYILIFTLVMFVSLGKVFAIEIDNESIVLPDELEVGTNYVSFTGFDNYTKEYQILDISGETQFISNYNDYLNETNETYKESYFDSLVLDIEGIIQGDNWEAMSNDGFDFTEDLDSDVPYLVIVKASSTGDDGSDTEVYGFNVYNFNTDDSSKTPSGAETENEDTGINDVLLIVGVPMILGVGVYLTSKKQYN